MPVIEPGNVIEYTADELVNDTTYYFAVTAFDAAGNESENYSFEASAKPIEGLHGASVEDNGATPAIQQVIPVTNTTLKIMFSEPVALPLENATGAFEISKSGNGVSLEVKSAALDAKDEDGVTVILTTANQEGGVEYLLKVGPEVKDLYENSVAGGSGNTATFRGKAVDGEVSPADELEEDQPAEEVTLPDTQAPVLGKTEAKSGDKIELTFNEGVVLGKEDTSEHFKLYERQTIEAKKAKAEKVEVEIKNVSLSKDGKTVFLQTGPQKETEYVLEVIDVKDALGNVYSFKADEDEENPEDGVTLRGVQSTLLDLIPPENVTNLLAKLKEGSTNIVSLNWTASVNSAGDLNDQLLYLDDGKAQNLGIDVTAKDVRGLTPGKEYLFKMTTKDKSNNESDGTVVRFKLPETGPGIIALGITSLFAGWYRRKKKKS